MESVSGDRLSLGGLKRWRSERPLSTKSRLHEKNRQSQKDHEYPPPDCPAGSQEEPYPARNGEQRRQRIQPHFKREALWRPTAAQEHYSHGDRKSTRLNSSHLGISYAVFCLKKKKQQHR